MHFIAAGALMITLAHSGAADHAVDPCRGELDAVTATDDSAGRTCRSPGALDPEAVAAAIHVEADAVPAAPKPSRDPLLFPAELGFIAVSTGVIGAAAVTGSFLSASQETDATGAALRQGAFWGGVSALSLAGGLAAAGLSTWVFDVSTGTLRLPLFDGEPR